MKINGSNCSWGNTFFREGMELGLSYSKKCAADVNSYADS